METKAPEPHERQEYAGRLQAILDAVEIGHMADDVRLYLQAMLRRHDLLRSVDARRFPVSAEQITLLLRAVYESTNGARALTVPILQAVLKCMAPIWVAKGLAFVEAFDQVDLLALQTSLSDMGLLDQFERVLRGRLEGILGPPHPPATPKPVKVKAVPKLPYRITRVVEIERRIEMGLKLAQIRSQAPSNGAYGKLRSKAIDVEQALASEAVRVAKVYGERPDIWRNTGWPALVALASPSLPPAKRQRFERRILDGEEVKAWEIVRVRGKLSAGRPKARGEAPQCL